MQNGRHSIKFELCADKIGSKFIQIYKRFVKFKKSKNMQKVEQIARPKFVLANFNKTN